MNFYNTSFAFKVVNGPCKISHVPNWSIFVSRPTQEQKLAKGREIQWIYFIRVGYYFKKRFSAAIYRVSESNIPYHYKSIVGTTGKYVRMHFVPGYILDRSTVMKYLHDWSTFVILLSIFFNIPNTNSFITLAWCQ